MDIVLNTCDRWFFTPYVYPESWPEDDIIRQLISLTIVVNINAVLLYFSLGYFSYIFLFDKKQMEHPKFLKVCCKRFSLSTSILNILESSSSRNHRFSEKYSVYECTNHCHFSGRSSRLFEVIRQF